MICFLYNINFCDLIDKHEYIYTAENQSSLDLKVVDFLHNISHNPANKSLGHNKRMADDVKLKVMPSFFC